MVNPERGGGGPVTVRILGPQFISLYGCLVISTIFNEHILVIKYNRRSYFHCEKRGYLLLIPVCSGIGTRTG